MAYSRSRGLAFVSSAIGVADRSGRPFNRLGERLCEQPSLSQEKVLVGHKRRALAIRFGNGFRIPGAVLPGQFLRLLRCQSFLYWSGRFGRGPVGVLREFLEKPSLASWP
jgi:hypothetical protein